MKPLLNRSPLAVRLKEANVVMGGWALTAPAYLGCRFLMVFVPMPRFGITPDVVSRQEFTGRREKPVDDVHAVRAGYVSSRSAQRSSAEKKRGDVAGTERSLLC